MPLYLVQFDDGQAAGCDVVELEAPDFEAARDDTMQALAEMAKFGVARGSEQLLAATIRDGAGRQLYRVTLTLTCSRLGQEASREGGA